MIPTSNTNSLKLYKRCSVVPLKCSRYWFVVLLLFLIATPYLEAQDEGGGLSATASGERDLINTRENPFAAFPRIEHENIQWQALPRILSHVNIGPDGRTWFQFCRDDWQRESGLTYDRKTHWYTGGPTLEQIKANIESEFSQPAPHIYGMRVALFEPGDRVWFCSPWERLLLGYNGETWITKELEGIDRVSDPQRYTCSNRNGLIDSYCNRYAGGVCWFLTALGVYRYDGENWTFLDVDERIRSLFRLEISPNGKFAVVRRHASPDIWIWRNNEWNEYRLPLEDPMIPTEQWTVRDDESIWIIGRNLPLTRLALSRDENQEKLETTPTPMTWEGGTSIIEPFSMSRDSHGRLYVASEEILQGNNAPFSGVVVSEGDRIIRIIRGPEFSNAWDAVVVQWPLGIEANRDTIFEGADSIYLSGRRVRLLDGKPYHAAPKEQPARSIPFRRSGSGPFLQRPLQPYAQSYGRQIIYNDIQAVGAEGNAYFYTFHAGYQPWCVYDTDAPPRPSLEVIEKEGYICAVSGSGAVWLTAPEGGPRYDWYGRRVPARSLIPLYDPRTKEGQEHWDSYQPIPKTQLTYFDQGEWHIVAWEEYFEKKDDWIRLDRVVRLTPGAGNYIIAETRDEFILIQGTDVLDHGDVFELVKRQRKRICEAFGPEAPQQNAFLAGNDKGHIWYMDRSTDRTLYVLVDEEWIDCREIMIEAGSKYGQAEDFIPFCENERILTGDHIPNSEGRAFFATVENGAPRFEETYRGGRNEAKLPALPLPNGELWLSVVNGFQPRVNGMEFGDQAAVRFDRNGRESERVVNSGFPILFDPLGGLWLGGIRGSVSLNAYNILNDGAIRRLNIPGQFNDQYVTSDTIRTYCDRPGSLYVQTVEGLLHLVMDENEPSGYRFEETYSLLGIGDELHSLSRQGYMVFSKSHPELDANFIPFFYLVKLPKK